MKAAIPELLRVPLPKALDPSMNVTVPVGVPEAAVTVAVKVTDCLKTDGLADEARAVAVVALFTTWVTAFEVLPL